MGLHATFALANREEIAAEIERLIDLLDAADAPFADLEEEQDHSGEERGEVEDWRPEGFHLPLPVYGIDQSAGPINEREVDRAWRRHLMGEAA